MGYGAIPFAGLNVKVLGGLVLLTYEHPLNIDNTTVLIIAFVTVKSFTNSHRRTTSTEQLQTTHFFQDCIGRQRLYTTFLNVGRYNFHSTTSMKVAVPPNRYTLNLSSLILPLTGFPVLQNESDIDKTSRITSTELNSRVSCE